MSSDWIVADLEPPAGRAWQRFAVTWRPQRRGPYELCSRLLDRRQEPAAVRHPQRRPPRPGRGHL